MFPFRIVYVNSNKRLSGTHGDFTYKIDTPPDFEYDHICVLNICIPKSYYVVPDGYNTFTLIEDDREFTVTVPPGNYNRRSLQYTLGNIMTAASLSYGYAYTYTVTYPNTVTSADTGKYTFIVSNNGGVNPILTTNNQFYEQIGFDPNSVNTFVANELTSTNVIKLQSEDTLYLHSDIVDNGNDNILLEIYGNSADFTNITAHVTDIRAWSKKVLTRNSNVYRFYLSDENDVPINLNGLNINMTLMLYQMVPKDDRHS
jgi:hypothetical protein